MMGYIYLNTNGITVKCKGLPVGYKGFFEGEVYEVVDNKLLRKRVKQGVRLDRVVTSMVTDMSDLFRNADFNQPIGNWDVSEVTNMRSMFSKSNFNQPIGDWDVSKVPT